MWQKELAQIIQCRGCDQISFRSRREPKEPNAKPEERQYPAPEFRKLPRWFSDLEIAERELAQLMGEVYSATAMGSRRLALMGLRCAIDVVIFKTVGGNFNFGQGLAALASQGYLSSKDSDVLRAGIEAGHAAAHRNFCPEPNDLDRALDVVEHLIEKVFHLPSIADKLRTNIPPRF